MNTPSPPQDGTLPFINVFYTEGGLELVGFWDNGGREALLLRMKPGDVSVKESTGEVEITFPSQTGALVVVTLYGNRGFAETLKSAVEACRQSENVEERLISSRRIPSRGQSFPREK
ncbi:hypothetical protein [Thermococcus pacificus]|uniref:hypothetical protein n=1 Tax=Thermococcus pacificus TaxID=71998 RepID=UPI0012FD6964|nr:hypothetical protein [Thermococcus pacificus]